MLQRFKDWRHSLAHRLNLFDGDPETWLVDSTGNSKVLMVGYRCRTCGKLAMVTEAACGWQPTRRKA